MHFERDSRNISRFEAWAERWRATFGNYPPSYKRHNQTVEINAIADTMDPHRRLPSPDVNSPIAWWE